MWRRLSLRGKPTYAILPDTVGFLACNSPRTERLCLPLIIFSLKNLLIWSVKLSISLLSLATWTYSVSCFHGSYLCNVWAMPEHVSPKRRPSPTTTRYSNFILESRGKYFKMAVFWKLIWGVNLAWLKVSNYFHFKALGFECNTLQVKISSLIFKIQPIDRPTKFRL